MKNVKLLLMSLMLLGTILSTDKAISQTGPRRTQAINQTNTGWWEFQSTSTLYAEGPLLIQGGSTQSSYQAVTPEIITVRKATIAGTSPLVVVSGSFQNDTINLLKTNYVTGQIINIITTYASNDTLVITHDGSYAGATATFLLSPGTAASYKKTRIYYDGTNYWPLQ